MGFRFGETTLEWISVARPLVLIFAQWPITAHIWIAVGLRVLWVR